MKTTKKEVIMYIGKRKSGIYYLEFFDESTFKIRRISTGARTRPDALNYLATFKQNQLEQRNKINQVRKKKLSSFKDEYVIFMKSTHSKKYITSIKLAFKKLEEFVGGETFIEKISTKDTQLFASDTYYRTKYSAFLYLRTLKAAFSRAVEWEYLAENPFKKIRLPKLPKNFPIFINEVDLNQILEKCDNNTFKDIFITAFYTGMRLGEILNLKWGSIDLITNTILVSNDGIFTTKSKKERMIPINEKLISMLKSRLPNPNTVFSNYVFKNPKGFKLNESWVSNNFKRAVRKANLDDRIHFHTLRHSFASNLVQKGVSLYVVKELLGHEDITTTQIYSHLSKNNLIEAVNLL
jgi:site-specific recombinase XerD